MLIFDKALKRIDEAAKQFRNGSGKVEVKHVEAGKDSAATGSGTVYFDSGGKMRVEIATVLKKEGKLNEVRKMFNLEAIPEATPGHNPFSKKFDEEEMLRVADGLFEALEGIDRFGMYYFISRVIHPLLASPDTPKYDAPINTIAREICSKIPNYMDMGHLALFVFQR